MRNRLYVVLSLAGVAGLAVVLARWRGWAGNPSRKAERLLDRCRQTLDGIEHAASDLHGPQSAAQ